MRIVSTKFRSRISKWNAGEGRVVKKAWAVPWPPWSCLPHLDIMRQERLRNLDHQPEETFQHQHAWLKNRYTTLRKPRFGTSKKEHLEDDFTWFYLFFAWCILFRFHAIFRDWIIGYLMVVKHQFVNHQFSWPTKKVRMIWHVWGNFG